MHMSRALPVVAAVLLAPLATACSAGSNASNAAGSSTTAAGSVSSAVSGQRTASPSESVSPEVASTVASSTAAPSVNVPKGPCGPLNPSTVSALFTVPVGNQAFKQAAGPGYACLYGIGKNSSAPGARLGSALDDVMSATLVRSGGRVIFHAEITNYRSGYTVTSLTGIGDEADYAYSAALNNPPVIIAIKGQAFCDVTINPASGAELGLAASSGVHSVRAADAASVAKKEAQFCADLFAQG